MMYILIAIIFLLFSVIWNFFAVVGIVLTFKYFIERSGKKRHNQTLKPDKNKLQDVKPKEKSVTTKTIAQTISKETKPIQTPSRSLETSSLLLYTGAFLVGFAIFIFVAFNWDSFSNDLKSILIVAIVALFYLLGYIFSLKEAYSKVSGTFIFLGSLSIAFAGIGLWNFYVKEEFPSLRVVDYGFIYSLFLSCVYILTYLTRRSRVYFFFSLFAIYMTVFYSAPSLINEGNYQIPYILVVFVSILLISQLLFSKRHLYKDIAKPLFRITILILNCITVIQIVDILFSINQTDEKLLAASSLFVSYIALIALNYKSPDRFKLEPVVEGLLLPVKLYLLFLIFSFTSSTYTFLGISLTLFVLSFALSISSQLKNSVVKAFIYSVLVSSTLFNLVLPFFKPVFIQEWDPLPMAISYIILSVAVQIRSYSPKYAYGRFLNIPLDLVAFVMFLIALEKRVDIGLGEMEVVGMLLLIPTVIYTAEWLLTTSKQKLPLIIGSVTFFTFATILTIAEPEFLFAITAIGVVYYFVLTVYSRKSAFSIPMMLYGFMNATASIYLFKYDQSIWILSLIMLLILFGNIWRVPLKELSRPFGQQISKTMQKSSMVLSFWIGFILLISIFESDEILTLFNALLFSLFTLTVGKKEGWFKYLTGIGFTLGFWWLIQRSDTPAYANAQLYAFPLVIYFLFVAFLTEKKNKATSTLFKTASYTLPLSIAMSQSVTDPDPYSLYHGLLVLTISSVLLVFGVVKKDKLLMVITTVFIITESFILLLDLILSIPWWLYVGFLGMFLISMSVWIIYKLSKSSNQAKPS